MRVYRLLGLNHCLCIPIDAGGMMVVLRAPGERTHLVVKSEESCVMQMSADTLDGIDTGSSRAFPFPIEVYGNAEAWIGVFSAKRIDPAMVKSVAASMCSTGGVVETKTIEDALYDRLKAAIPRDASTSRLTRRERLGAIRFFAGFLADVIQAAIAEKPLNVRYKETSLDEEEGNAQ